MYMLFNRIFLVHMLCMTQIIEQDDQFHFNTTCVMLNFKRGFVRIINHDFITGKYTNMKTKNKMLQKKKLPDVINNPEQESRTNGGKEVQKTGKKKKRNSALVAASKARSAVSRVNKHAYRDIDFAHTGTNFTYREEGGID